MYDVQSSNIFLHIFFAAKYLSLFFFLSFSLVTDRYVISLNSIARKHLQICKRRANQRSRTFRGYRVTRALRREQLRAYTSQFNFPSIFAGRGSIFYDSLVTRNSILAFKYFCAYENLINRNSTLARNVIFWRQMNKNEYSYRINPRIPLRARAVAYARVRAKVRRQTVTWEWYRGGFKTMFSGAYLGKRGGEAPSGL